MFSVIEIPNRWPLPKATFSLANVAHLYDLAILVYFCCIISHHIFTGLKQYSLISSQLFYVARLNSLLRVSEGQNQGVGRAEFLFWTLGVKLAFRVFLIAELSSLDWGPHFLAGSQHLEATLRFFPCSPSIFKPGTLFQLLYAWNLSDFLLHCSPKKTLCF